MLLYLVLTLSEAFSLLSVVAPFYLSQLSSDLRCQQYQLLLTSYRAKS